LPVNNVRKSRDTGQEAGLHCEGGPLPMAGSHCLEIMATMWHYRTGISENGRSL
jgi:hypothetical protein